MLDLGRRQAEMGREGPRRGAEVANSRVKSLTPPFPSVLPRTATIDFGSIGPAGAISRSRPDTSPGPVVRCHDGRRPVSCAFSDPPVRPCHQACRAHGLPDDRTDFALRSSAAGLPPNCAIGSIAETAVRGKIGCLHRHWRSFYSNHHSADVDDPDCTDRLSRGTL